MKGRNSTKGQCGGLIVGQMGRFRRQRPVFRHAPVLGMAAHADVTEGNDWVPHLERAYVLADRFNVTDGCPLSKLAA